MRYALEMYTYEIERDPWYEILSYDTYDEVIIEYNWFTELDKIDYNNGDIDYIPIYRILEYDDEGNITELMKVSVDEELVNSKPL